MTFRAAAQTSTHSVTLAWNPSADATVIGYRLYYGVASGAYTNSLTLGNTTITTVSNLASGVTYYFVVTAYNESGLESVPSNEVTYTTPDAPGNQAPTLNALSNLTISEDAGTQTVNLSGISSGSAGENQTLTVTASSSNTGLIPNPTITYTSPNSTGTLVFAPAANLSGSAVITVVVNDGQATNNTITRTFTVTVNAVNDQPTLNTLSNLTINEDAGLQTVNLSGISSGATNESQGLTVTASSSNTGVVPHPVVTYTSPNTAGTIRFTPMTNAFGTATITITVNDGQAANNTIVRTFTVTVNAVNDQPTLSVLSNMNVSENSAAQTVNLSGISSGAANESQTLTVTASSSNTSLVPNPTVTYTSPGSTGSLTFTPRANSYGTATVTVNVNDGQAANHTLTRTFTVTVSARPRISTIANQVIQTNTSAGPVPFTIFDPDTAAASLMLSATSSSTGLIPVSNIVFGGSGTNRTVTLTPLLNASGVAQITLTVSDGVRTSNSVFQVTVQTAPPPPQGLIIVSTSGAGTVTPDLSGQQLAAGKEYTLTATPAEGQVFAGWTGSVNSQNPKIKVVGGQAMVLQANFVKDPYKPVKGTYSGLFFEDDEVRLPGSGSFRISLSAGGTYSGRLQFAKAKHSFKGKLNLELQATNIVLRKGSTPLTLVFRVGTNAEADQVFGTLSDGNWIAELAGDRATFHAVTNPAPMAGSYTFIIPGETGNPSVPAGHGYGTVTVSTSGKLKFAGSLADKTKLSQGASVSRTGMWPLHAGLYSGNGAVISWQEIEGGAGGDIEGALSWIKLTNSAAKMYPAGFALERDAFGQRYLAPIGSNVVSLTDGQIRFGGGNLIPGFTNLVAIGLNNTVTNLSSNQMSLKFTASKGTFKGKVTDPATGLAYSFSGVVLQGWNTAAGYLVGTNQSSHVMLEP